MTKNPENELIFDETSLSGKSYSILIVEDNPGDVVIIRELLKSSMLEFSLKNVSTVKESIVTCAGQNFDIILLDLGLPDSEGLETLKKIQVFDLKSPVVVMTGFDDEDTALQALREGAQDYLVKNRISTDILLRSIKYSIERKKIQGLLQKNAKQFSLLSATTTAINESQKPSDILGVTSKNLSSLLENMCIVTIDFFEKGNLVINGLPETRLWVDRLTDYTGVSLDGPVAVFDPDRINISEIFSDGRLHRMIPEQNGKKEKPDDIEVYAIGFTKGGMIYGGTFIFSQGYIGADDVSIIESICSQVSLTLHRKTIETDLTVSENRYRILSSELELKVRERTRDLENLNYQLSQELIERHVVEEALRKSEANLRELNATKDKFFNIIAHDLKNPFTCLLGSTELLTENFEIMSPGSIKELVGILSDSAKSGYSILQNLLDWSRSQTGMIKFTPETFNLREVFDENLAEIRITTAKKEITIVSDISENFPVITDKNMLNAVIRNLLSNAVKFTPRSGRITLNASQEDDKVTISVADTGIGIPENRIQELFRIDSKFTRSGTDFEKGTGLGLKICKEFIELQGGTIRVESTINHGSEFIISIPSSARN